MADKPPSAVALKYSPEADPAPRVTARGRGDLAERIIREARRAGVPIREDPALVELLLRLDLDACIPPELYRAVAEILFFLYRCNEQWKVAHGLRPHGPPP
ncbi:EscU/YscU/HrcU family type III secretion system export apparatus switch protein [Nitrospira sp. Kam-Ns4a]